MLHLNCQGSLEGESSDGIQKWKHVQPLLYGHFFLLFPRNKICACNTRCFRYRISNMCTVRFYLRNGTETKNVTKNCLLSKNYPTRRKLSRMNLLWAWSELSLSSLFSITHTLHMNHLHNPLDSVFINIFSTALSRFYAKH